MAVMNMKERYLAATDFRTYLKSVEKNQELWHGIYERVSISPEILEEARRIPGTWHLLALSEDWCGDAVNLLPVLARLTEEVAGLDLRVLSRDQNPDLMDAHLTDGKSRSIPVVLLLDVDYVERGWWGPRAGTLTGVGRQGGPLHALGRALQAGPALLCQGPGTDHAQRAFEPDGSSRLRADAHSS